MFFFLANRVKKRGALDAGYFNSRRAAVEGASQAKKPPDGWSDGFF
jgi:hypothetical protein